MFKLLRYFSITSLADGILKRQGMERQATEEALRESELKFRSVAQSANDAIISADSNGAIIYWNKAAQNIFGFTEEEIIGKPLTLLMPERFRSAHQAGLKRMREGGEARVIGKTVTLYGLRKDGEEFPLELSLGSWKSKQGLFFSGILRDITERMQAHAEIARLASFPEHNPNPVIEIDASGRITYLNPAARTQFPEMETDGLRHPLLEGLAGTFQHGDKDLVTREIRFADKIYEQYISVIGDSMRIRVANVTERRRAEEDLKKSRSQLALAQEIAQLGSWDWDIVNNTVSWSAELYRIFGLKPQEFSLTYETYLNYVHPDDRARVMDIIAGVRNDHRPFSFDHRAIRPDGSTRMLHARGEVVLDRTGKAIRLLGTAQDITERMRTEQELRLLQSITLAISEAYDLHAALAVTLQKVCESTGWIFGQAWTPASDGAHLECSPAWFGDSAGLEEIRAVSQGFKFVPGQGLPGRVWSSKTPAWIRDVTRDANFPRAPAAGRAGLKAALSIPVLVDNEVIAVIEFFMREPRDEDERLVKLVSTVAMQLGTVIQRKQSEERVNYLAHHDILTGLPNRVLLHDRLQQTMIDAERHERLAAVLFLDLDRFKTINDTLGHEIGDMLIEAVAERLQRCVRGGDTVARLGGDEFTVVLADVAHVDDVARIAHKILQSVAKPFQIASKELFITTSIGITLFPLDDNTPEGLLKNADIAMYRAKETGRNVYRYFTAEMNTRALERLRLETDLRHALGRNELLLMYQPQIDFKNGRMIGVEALIRWRHPELGLISPAQFIPVAEETGLIGPIGDWVLHTACTQNKAWQDAGLPPVCVTVNVSAWQLKRQGLVRSVTRTLKETGLAPKYLGLELTESMLIENVEQTVAMLNNLHALGIGFSIDDFGTGYSSLSYLRRFPIDILKVDQSFIRGIPSNAEDAAIARAIITMAHSLGIKAIAEGVETEEQIAFLRAHKCDGMQGFYFSPPVPAEAIAKLFQTEQQLKNVRRG